MVNESSPDIARFSPCDCSQGGHFAANLQLSIGNCQLSICQYLIPFAPLAFAPQRQKRSSSSLSPPAFLLISTHFTAPLEVPTAPTSLQLTSIQGTFPVKPKDFTPDLINRLRAL